MVQEIKTVNKNLWSCIKEISNTTYYTKIPEGNITHNLEIIENFMWTSF